ncbi:MAG TPA: citrate synthase, partial [Dehalococcoidia bacterium]
GEKGVLEFRGIPIEDLAAKASFEEAAYLLLFGALPTQGQLDRFDNDLRHHRRIKFRLVDLLKTLPEQVHPMEALQSAAAALGSFYPGRDAQNVPERYWSAVRLIAKFPTIVAAIDRVRHGDEPVKSRDDLSLVANFLYMLHDEEPDPEDVRLLETALILHMDHTMNASTFTARVVGSTLADPYSVVSSAVGALMGPLHGGANERVLVLLDRIGSAQAVEIEIPKMLDSGEKIMGFGHRVYHVKDPRAVILQSLAEERYAKRGTNPHYPIALELERVLTEKLGDRGIYPNVDFFSGCVYESLGFERDLFTPLFAIARVVGWLSHWLEQMEDNRIFRPTQIYTGTHGVRYTPIEQRSVAAAATA